mgnify:CR=1 FL=1
MARYAMVIDLRDCVRCRTCYVACKFRNKLPVGKVNGKECYRLGFIEEEIGKYPDVKRPFFPVHCNHCDNPTCLKACPVGAISKNEQGVVVTDKKKCIGGGACVEACPYEARYINEDVGAVDSCDFCFSRGMKPSCLELCPSQCMYFGDLDDPSSKVTKLVASGKAKPLKPEAGTKPNVYYIDRQ